MRNLNTDQTFDFAKEVIIYNMLWLSHYNVGFAYKLKGRREADQDGDRSSWSRQLLEGAVGHEHSDDATTAILLSKQF